MAWLPQLGGKLYEMGGANDANQPSQTSDTLQICNTQSNILKQK